MYTYIIFTTRKNTYEQIGRARIYIYTLIHMYMYICMYIYICLYIYICTPIYMYMHTPVSWSPSFAPAQAVQVRVKSAGDTPANLKAGWNVCACKCVSRGFVTD